MCYQPTIQRNFACRGRFANTYMYYKFVRWNLLNIYLLQQYGVVISLYIQSFLFFRVFTYYLLNNFYNIFNWLLLLYNKLITIFSIYIRQIIVVWCHLRNFLFNWSSVSESHIYVYVCDCVYIVKY